MEGPRQPLESEWPNLIQFLTRSLRGDSGWSIETEYPTAFSSHNRHNVRVMTHNDKIVSHSVVKPMIIRSPSLIYKVAGIGSVVTDENYRNQGFSQKVLHECLNLAEQQKCDLAILWTNLHDFYRKLGFELAGSENSYVIENEFSPPPLDLRYSMDKNIAPEAINRLYSLHSVGTVRTNEEIKQYLKIPNSRLFTAWNKDGSLAAFAMEGKGADLQGYIHEWGGQVPELLNLLNYARKQTGKALTIITPRHSQNLNNQLKNQFPHFEGYLGMLKIVDELGLFGKIKRAFRAEGIADFVLEKRGQGYLFGIGRDLLIVNEPTDIIKLLFGPVDFQVFDFQDAKTATQLSRILPLPLWIWGWDSV
jgi:GNAT superfamily N-acetyltransferase